MDLRYCNNLVISCIDFRIQDIVREWLEKQLPEELYDYVAFAGGVKDILSAEKQVEISERLHHITDVFLFQHEDCGAYGKEEDVREKQFTDLHKAKEAILTSYPTLTTHLYFIHISGVFEKLQ